MRSEGLIEAQRKAMQAASQLNLKVEMEVNAAMKPENVERIRAAHPDLYDPSIASLPDGWTEAVKVFLEEFEALGEGMMSPGDVSFERTNSGLKAHIFANPEMKWTPRKSWELLKWQRVLYKSVRDACEWCSKLDAQPVQLGERVTFFLCQQHRTSAEEKLTAQVQAFDARVRFREEVSVLFQEHSTVWLNVSDHNTPILRKALTDIKKIVVDRDLIGKIYVTKITESEGQLFLSVRYDQAVDMASRLDVDDIIHHAQWLSDEASLKANRGGHGDDA